MSGIEDKNMYAPKKENIEKLKAYLKKQEELKKEETISNGKSKINR